MSIWTSTPPELRDRKVAAAMVRPQEQWGEIFAQQTSTPQEAAARIFGDLICFTGQRKNGRGFQEPRDGYFADVEQLARALEAYVDYRKGEPQ